MGASFRSTGKRMAECENAPSIFWRLSLSVAAILTGIDAQRCAVRAASATARAATAWREEDRKAGLNESEF